MKICRTCKHWAAPTTPTVYGECAQSVSNQGQGIPESPMVAKDCESYSAVLETMSVFSCSCWTPAAPTCLNCKHWKLLHVGAGVCQMLNKPCNTVKAGIYTTDGHKPYAVELRTDASFHCQAWELLE